MLSAARRILELEKENYKQIRDYRQQIGIIRHDFRHHIHALQHMNDSERREYLRGMQSDLDGGQELFFCGNAAVNSLLQQYAAQSKAEGTTISPLMICCFRLSTSAFSSSDTCWGMPSSP